MCVWMDKWLDGYIAKYQTDGIILMKFYTWTMDIEFLYSQTICFHFTSFSYLTTKNPLLNSTKKG